MRCLSKTVLAAALLGLASTPAAFAGAIISPVSATIDSGGPGFGSIADTYNHNGLLSGFTSGVTDFDTYIATNPIHSYIFGGNEWFGNEDTTTAQVTYDLGAVTSIDALALWNEESSGIGTLDLLVSSDGTTFTSLLSGLHPIDNPLADYPAQVFDFSDTSTRYVRFVMSDCPQPDPADFASCAIGEVAFRETGDGGSGNTGVPEPASIMLLGAALAGFGAYRRRRAKR